MPVNVGDALNTRLPVPVSSDITDLSSSEDVAPNTLSLSVRFALSAKLPVTAEKTLAFV